MTVHMTLQAVQSFILSFMPILISSASAFYVIYKFHSERLTLRRAEGVITSLLSDTEHRFIPFRQIQYHIGGFSDDELRQTLVRIGAIRLASSSKIEHWVILNRLSHAERKNLFHIEIPGSNTPPAVELRFIDEIGEAKNGD